jgi:hypothetical protein
MTTATLPEGWYTDTADGKAHHAEELIGAAVRPVCRTRETQSGDIRDAEAGDKVCDACVTELHDGIADITFPTPLGQCLGCQRLQQVIDPGLVATHDVAGSSTERCMGSGRRPASHDGRDAVRLKALATLVARQDEIDGLRHTLADAILTRGLPLRTLTDTVTLIVHREAEQEFWDELIGSGDYLTVAGYVLRILSRRMLATSNGDTPADLWMIGARGWLTENRLHIQRLAQDNEAAAALINAVLETA